MAGPGMLPGVIPLIFFSPVQHGTTRGTTIPSLNVSCRTTNNNTSSPDVAASIAKTPVETLGKRKQKGGAGLIAASPARQRLAGP